MLHIQRVGISASVAALVTIAIAGMASGAARQTAVPNPPLAISQDGARFAVVTADQQIQVFSSRNPSAKPLVLDAPRKIYTTLAFNRDGTAIMAASIDRTIRRFSVLTGNKTGNDLKLSDPEEATGAAPATPKRGSLISAIAFSPDNSEVLITDSGTQRLFRFTRSSTNLDYAPNGVKDTSTSILTLASDGKGKWIGTDSVGVFHVFDYDLTETGTIQPADTAPAKAITVSQDSKYLMTGDDKEIKLWSFGGAEFARRAKSMEVVARYSVGFPLAGLAFRRDGQNAVILNRPASIQEWAYNAATKPVTVASNTTKTPDPATDPPKTDPPKTDPPKTDPPPADPPADPPKTDPPKTDPPKTDPPVTNPPVTNPPKTDPPKTNPNTPKNVATTAKPALPAFSKMRSLPGHLEYVNTVAFSPKVGMVASGSRDKTVQLWDVETGDRTKIWRKHTEYVSSVAFSPTGASLASGGWDSKIYIWDVDNDSDAPVRTLNGHTNLVLSVAYNKAGTRLVSGSNDKTIIVWNTANGQVVKKSKLMPNAIAAVAFSPDGKWIAGGCLDGNIYIWDAATLTQAKVLTSSPAKPIFSVVFIDNSTVVAGGKDGVLRVWNATTGKPGATLVTSGKDIFSVSYNSKRHLLAAGGADKLIRVWNVPTPLTNWHTATTKVDAPVKLSGHTDTVRAVDFSDDGEMLASGGWDYNILLWKTSGTGSGVASAKE